MSISLYPVNATRPVYLPNLDLITRIIFPEECHLCISLWSLFHFPVTSSLLGTNNLFSIFLRLCSSYFVRVQISHPYTTMDKIIVLCIVRFIFLNSILENKSFYLEWYQTLPEFNLFLISSWIQLEFVSVIPIYLNFAALSNNFKQLPLIFVLRFLPTFHSRGMNMYLVFSALPAILEQSHY